MSYFIDENLLNQVCLATMDGHIGYGLGSKAPSLSSNPDAISRIDCSGFVRYVMFKVCGIVIPDGSWNQNDWAKKAPLPEVSYSGKAAESDGMVRIAFLTQNKHRKVGHVWLVLNQWTIESHGGVGPSRRQRRWPRRCPRDR